MSFRKTITNKGDACILFDEQKCHVAGVPTFRLTLFKFIVQIHNSIVITRLHLLAIRINYCIDPIL